MSAGREPRQPVVVGEAAPINAPTEGLSALVRSMLPERSPEDRAAGIIRIRLGRGKAGKEYQLPVLSIKQNRVWKKVFQDELGGLLEGLSQQADGRSVINFIGGLTEQQLVCVQAYDVDKVLPDLEEVASEQQLLTAFLGVTAAAYPFAEAAMAALQESSDLQSALRLEFWKSMSSSQPNMAGPQGTSKAN